VLNPLPSGVGSGLPLGEIAITPPPVAQGVQWSATYNDTPFYLTVNVNSVNGDTHVSARAATTRSSPSPTARQPSAVPTESPPDSRCSAAWSLNTRHRSRRHLSFSGSWDWLRSGRPG
jgi:hypothetical protein